VPVPIEYLEGLVADEFVQERRDNGVALTPGRVAARRRRSYFQEGDEEVRINAAARARLQGCQDAQHEGAWVRGCQWTN
jgi:hypothetical protein